MRRLLLQLSSIPYNKYPALWTHLKNRTSFCTSLPFTFSKHLLSRTSCIPLSVIHQPKIRKTFRPNYSTILFKHPLSLFSSSYFHTSSFLANNQQNHIEETRIPKEKVKVVFVEKDGITKKEVEGNIGESILELAHRNNIDLEGACEGSLACST